MTKKKEEKVTIASLEKKLKLKQQLFAKYYIFGFTEKKKIIVTPKHKIKNEDGEDEVVDGEPVVQEVEERVRMANATRSYAKAYEKDYVEDESSCAANGARLLRTDKIQAYMRLLVDEAGFNDTAVDARLREIMFDGEDKTSVVAVKHYNELKQRVTTRTKIELTEVDMGQRAKDLLQPFVDDDAKE